MKNLFLLVIGLFTLHLAEAQHTFSIVAVDSVTGEIGSAGATCGDTITWPGSLGAMLISDVIPGTGAIHTQAYYNETNQENAHQQMLDGNSPEEIIDWLVDNDAQNFPAYRQYGIVDFNGGSPRSAGWTGSNCDDYKNHVLGPNYAIQGNILLGQVVLDQMEENFNAIEGPLHQKLMAAMQGANMVGADTRCTVEGTSSLSSFLRVAQPDDSADDLWMELWVGATDDGVEPIDELQEMYDEFFATNTNGFNMDAEVKISPNPVESGMITIEYRGVTPDLIRLSDISGADLKTKSVRGLKNKVHLDVSDLPKGIFMLMSFKNGVVISTDKVVVR